MKNSLNLVLIILFLAGCTPSPTATPPLASATAVSTGTATLTALPTLTPTATPVPRFTQQCLPVSDQAVGLQDIVKSGTVLRSDHHLIDLASGIQYKYPLIVNKEGADISGMQFSPDRLSLAYDELLNNGTGEPEKEILWVVDIRGKLISQVKLDGTGLYLTR